ncbi:hypothetical protein [Algoriphagus confluentis]|uniref:DUF4476 domain-containing protein n=1 Tax=Algoriphagus confluentis TaxID=1697556 RepID=A0ABQ6PKT2_9BACT|nr:hypothetical protein Aconfl_04300 [Algoriphagus confluentis]
MRILTMLLFSFLISASGFAKDPETKTFLVLFKIEELKQAKTSLNQIEQQFSSFFTTKTYSGNSEPALLISIPNCDFDECFLGEFLVDTGLGQKVQLQKIAFRLYDLTENKDLHQIYLAKFEEDQSLKKKPVKPTRLATSNP